MCVCVFLLEFVLTRNNMLYIYKLFYIYNKESSHLCFSKMIIHK